MTGPERWHRVQQLCEDLESTPSAERELRLAELEPNPELRSEALALLESLQREETLRAHHRDRPGPQAPPPEIDSRYRLLERLGAGGSGVVYRALRRVGGVEQMVAVKLFDRRRVDGEDAERFTREQHMLAALDHPGIVRFLDGGIAADGTPFLAMDLAEGEPVTAYCEARQLPLAKRVELVAAVCDAVQAAHQRLIVHLDLKPSNILVTDAGAVKLLDFGTAKLMGPAGDLTVTRQMTPVYASPERLRGDGASVQCDVYSIGLILYEVLSGGWPFAGRESLVAMAERAAGRAAMRPLSEAAASERLRAQLRGDLTAICAKALEHDPALRYASVAALADDLAAYLEGRPVAARRAGAFYRVRKFVRRHAWGVAAASVFVAGLAGATVYSLEQARVARAEAARADASSRFLINLLILQGTDSRSRPDMTVHDLLRLAEQRVPTALASQAGAASDVDLALGRAFQTYSAGVESAAAFRRALERSRAAGDIQREARALVELAYLDYAQGRQESAWQGAQRAVGMWKQHPDRFGPVTAVETLMIAGTTMLYLRIADPAHREYLQAAVDIARQNPAVVSRNLLARCLSELAMSYQTLDARFEEAAGMLAETVKLYRADPEQGAALSSVLVNLGIVERTLGRFGESEKDLREAYELSARLFGQDHITTVTNRGYWAASLAEVGQLERGYAEAREALAKKRVHYPARASLLLWGNLAPAAYTACLTARYRECEALAREAIESLGAKPREDDYRVHDGRGYLGLALAGQGRMDEARPLIEDSLSFSRSRNRKFGLMEALAKYR